MGNNSGAKVLICGLMIGAAAGLLLAPKAGKENRQYLRQKFNEVRQWVQEKRLACCGQDEADADIPAEFSK